ncbi:MAG: restriction endonuclease subunit R, partial [bacterium]
MTDATIVAHLKGRHVMGVYPMLPDDTCWFLAADFDETTWKEDVTAFVETCRQLGLHPAVERSRSGNGAHVWFFFSAPVAAATARTMGSYLITETMSRRHELSLGSYDRLFPNQDTMPRGGFGNLIALPLQHEPRRHGNSVFLDDNLNPPPNDAQWAFLASVQRIDPAIVMRIASEATRTGSELDLSTVDVDDDEDSAPWMRPPSGKRRLSRLSEPVPSVVRAVLCQKLFVEKALLPSALLNQMKRLAAFQNPEFYKRQGMRLSTSMTPRVISCATDLPQHIGLPRGCRTQLETLLAEYESQVEIDDQRVSGTPTTFRFRGELTAMQQEAVTALVAHDIGVFVAPPGSGKTVVGTYLVAQRACSTLILVN